MDSRSLELRLFVSIHVPEAVRRKLSALQRRFELLIPGEFVRWASFEQMHLTIEFLGNVASLDVPNLKTALATVAARQRSFHLAAECLGAFSSVRNPRVIWAGLTGDVDRLMALQAEVRGSVLPWEREPEKRRYRPHLTLGRVREMKARELREVGIALEDTRAQCFGEWKVEEFALMQSKLSPHGAQHSVLATFPLQPLER